MKLGELEIGTMIRCPNHGCGMPAKVQPSRQYLQQYRNPHWSLVECPRCGKTQYGARTTVELAPAPPEESPIVAAPVIDAPRKQVKSAR